MTTNFIKIIKKKKSCLSITIAAKYTLLCETSSLSLRNMFFDFLCRSPQSTKISQYVLNIVAITELTRANTCHVNCFFSSKAVLMTTATIVKKYLKPLYPCAMCFSSNNRRTHCIKEWALSQCFSAFTGMKVKKISIQEESFMQMVDYFYFYF